MRRAIVLLPLPLALAACGGSGKSSSSRPAPIAAIKAAAQKTGRTSAHVKLLGTGTVAGVTVSLAGTGDFDNAKHLGLLHASLSAAGTTGAIDEVIDGTTLYMKSPLMAGGLPHGKTWMRLDLQKFGKTLGVDFSQLMSEDPAQSLAQVQTITSGKDLGTETIDGVKTTHYRVDIDVSKLPQGAKIEALTHARYAPEDVWLDGAGYVRRIHVRYSYAPATTGRQTQTITMNFSRFGEVVSAKIPPASQVFDATSASLKGLGG